ncbi:MAG: adenosine deaminase [Streptosporangiaceae bacterium]|jgi:adenosine deaminase|nr:adenosine deaminase [Streptosporangiaceae bacterium]
MDLIKALPKVELHVHLEGAFSAARIVELAGKSGVPLPRPIDRFFEFDGLGEFLTLLDWWCGLVRTEEDAELLAYDFARHLSADGIVYAEVITNPTHWSGLPLEPLITAFGAGFGRAHAEGHTDCRLNLSILRGQSAEEALELVEWMGSRRPDRVVGLSVDGNEAATGRTGERFAPAYARAHELGFGLTAHAGESSGPEGVWDALDLLHVSRIDHGVRAAEDPELVRRLADERVTLNICLSSNLSLVYPALREHPIGLLHKAGVPVTINTDDPLMLGVTLAGEMDMAAEHLGWDISDLAAATHRAVDAAFCSAEEKNRLHAAVIAFAGSLT